MKRYEYRVTNVEYTEFARLGIPDSSIDDDSELSVFPANTNVLYVGLGVRARAAGACGWSGSLLLCPSRLRCPGGSWRGRSI